LLPFHSRLKDLLYARIWLAPSEHSAPHWVDAPRNAYVVGTGCCPCWWSWCSRTSL